MYVCMYIGHPSHCEMAAILCATISSISHQSLSSGELLVLSLIVGLI